MAGRQPFSLVDGLGALVLLQAGQRPDLRSCYRFFAPFLVGRL